MVRLRSFKMCIRDRDKGSQLNKTVVSFDNLQEITPVVTGIVLHKQNPMGYSFDADAGYIACLLYTSRCV